MAKINNVNVTPTSTNSNRATESLSGLVTSQYIQSSQKNFIVYSADLAQNSNLMGSYGLISDASGWLSATPSGAGGVFSTPQVITLDFDAPVELWGFRIVGKALDNYPVAYTLTFRSGTTDIKTINVTDGSKVLQEHNFDALLKGVTQIELSITKISAIRSLAQIVNLYSLTKPSRKDTLAIKVKESSYSADKKSPRREDTLKLRAAEHSKQIVGFKRNDYSWVDTDVIPPNTIKYIRYSPYADGTHSTEYKDRNSKYIGVGYMPKEYVEHENLYTGTKDFSGTWQYKTYWSIVQNAHENFAVASKVDEYRGLSQTLQTRKGEKYTISALARMSYTESSKRCQFFASNSAGVNNIFEPHVLNVRTDNGVWTRISFSTEVLEDSDLRLRLEPAGTALTVDLLEVCAIKVERGSIATPWTPAPQDWLTNPANFTWQEIKPTASLKVVDTSKITNVHSRMKDYTRRIYGKVHITYFNPMLESLLSYDSSAMSNHSNYNQLMNAEMGDGTPNYFTMYDNDLSGGFQLASQDAEFGWISANVCDNQGYFYGTPGIVPPNMLPHPNTFDDYVLQQGFSIIQETYEGAQILRYEKSKAGTGVRVCEPKEEGRIPAVLMEEYKLSVWVRFNDWNQLPESFQIFFNGYDASGDAMDGIDLNIKTATDLSQNGKWVKLTVSTYFSDSTVTTMGAAFNPYYQNSEASLNTVIDFSKVIIKKVSDSSTDDEDTYAGYPFPNPPETTRMIFYSANANGTNRTTTKQPDSKYVGIAHVPNEILKSENLFSNSDFNNGTSGWSRSNNSVIAVIDQMPSKYPKIDGARVMTNTNSGQSTGHIVREFSMLDVGVYTLSSYVFAPNDYNGAYIGINKWRNDTSWVENANKSTATKGSWVRLTLTVNITIPGKYTFGVGGGTRATSDASTMYATRPKLERGSVATEWTPSLEDWLNAANNITWQPLTAPSGTVQYARYSVDPNGSNLAEFPAPERIYRGIAHMPAEIDLYPNLLLNSDFKNVTHTAYGDIPTSFGMSTDGTLSATIIGNVNRITKTNQPASVRKVFSYNVKTETFQAGTVLTFSMDILIDENFINPTNSTSVSLREYKTGNSANTESGISLGSTVRGKWTRLVMTKTIQENKVDRGDLVCGLYFGADTLGDISIRNWKLEVSNTASQWTLAPSDWLADPKNYKWEKIQPPLKWQPIQPTFLEVSFSARLLMDSYIIFDINKGTYPEEFDIYIYEEGLTAPIKKEIRGFSGSQYTFVNDYPEVYKLRFEFLKLNKPNYPVTVTEILVSSEVVYTDENQLIEIDFLEELTFEDDVTTLGSLSANEVTVTLDNIEKEFFYDNPKSLIRNQLRKNRRIEPWLGVEVTKGKIEWHPLGTFWSDQWDVPVESRVAAVTAYDTLYVLDKLEWKEHGVTRDWSVAQLLKMILDAAKRDFSWVQYNIDPQLSQIIIPYAWFERGSYAQALKKIASAGLINIYCDRFGVVQCKLRKFAQDNYQDSWSDDTNVISKNYPSMYRLLPNRINVQITNIQIVPNVEFLRLEEPFTVSDGTWLDFNFDKVCDYGLLDQLDCDPTVRVDESITSWGIRLHITGSGTIRKLVVKGDALETSVKQVKSAQDNKRIQQDGLQQVTITQDFVQTAERAQQLANDILEITSDDNYYVEVDYKGDIVNTLGDPIRLIGGISPTNRYIISRNKLIYDGALRGEATLIT